MKLSCCLIYCLLLSSIYSCSDRKIDNKAEVLGKKTLFDTIINEKKYKGEELDTVKQSEWGRIKASNDTVKYNFSIEDLGTEGNEGTAYYLNRNLKKIEFSIYTSMWRRDFQYVVQREKIYVTEENFNIYEHENKLSTKYYITNLQGVPQGTVDSTSLNILLKIRNTVPFKINQ